MSTPFVAARDAMAKTALGHAGASVVATKSPVADAELVEYAGALSGGRASEAYADFGGYKTRLASWTDLRSGAAGFLAQDPPWFLPAAAYAWGLFYNPSVLQKAGVEPPMDLDSMVAACRTLKKSGVTPIVLGNSHGWPLLGWYLQIYLSRSGVTAYRELVSGKRSFRSPEALAAFTELDGWISEGFFNRDAPSHIWTEALPVLEEGKAAFLFMAGYAWKRFVRTNAVAFATISPKKGQAIPEAVLGSLTGFVFPTAGGDREPALALADRWISAGAQGLADDGFRIPVSVPKGGRPSGSLSPIQAAAWKCLDGGTVFLPLLDAQLSEGQAYNLREAFRSWPMEGFRQASAIEAFAARAAGILEAATR